MGLKMALPAREPFIKGDTALVRLAMGQVRVKFAEVGHKPSEAVYAALQDIPLTVEKILKGQAKPAMYVCGLDVGVGKTTTLKATLSQVLGMLEPIGAVLCLGRLEQIETAIGDLSDAIGDNYAVLVGKGAKTKDGRLFAELGRGAANLNSAAVLFTTHAQMELRLQNVGTWEEAGAFFYNGKARPIRIWDETCSFRRPFSISKDELHKIAGADVPQPIKDYADRVLVALRGVEVGNLIDLPEAGDLPEKVADIIADLQDADFKRLAEPIRNLLSLSGKLRAGVRQADKGAAMIQFDLRLPADLLPLIVLDASADDRPLYDEGKEDVVKMRHADKRYDNVTVHVRNGNSGKTAFWNNYAERLKETAEIIKANPGRKVLVIHPKEQATGWRRWQAGKIKEGIEAALGHDHGRHIQYLHWGLHDAVNDYADCNLVICLTLYYLPQYVYEAMGRAAANVKLERPYEQERINAIESGELQATLRQGLGRSCIRKLEGNQAKECVIYVTVPTKSAVKRFFQPMFPGCKVANAEGKLDRREQVIAYLGKHGRERVFYDEIYDTLGMDKAAFSKLIKAMQPELERIGWRVVRSRPNFLLKA